MKNNKDIEEAVITVHEMTEDEHMRRMADLREKAIMDEKAIRRKGYEDGQKAGKEEERKNNSEKMKEIVANLKKIKMSDEQICQILNITQKELKELIK